MVKGGQDEGLGRSRSGLSTKIQLVTDARGRPLRFALTGGQAADAPQAIPLLSGIQAGCGSADKGFESDKIPAFIRARGATAQVQPSGPLGI